MDGPWVALILCTCTSLINNSCKRLKVQCKALTTYLKVQCIAMTTYYKAQMLICLCSILYHLSQNGPKIWRKWQIWSIFLTLLWSQTKPQPFLALNTSNTFLSHMPNCFKTVNRHPNQVSYFKIWLFKYSAERKIASFSKRYPNFKKTSTTEVQLIIVINNAN